MPTTSPTDLSSSLDDPHPHAAAAAVSAVICDAQLMESILRLTVFSPHDYELHDDDVLSHVACLARSTRVSKAFSIAASSDNLWREICNGRWQTKWGYEERWQQALLEVEPGGWRRRFVQAELDGTRGAITAEEVSSLMWDFRFWRGPQPQQHGELFRSGVRTSSSTGLRFEPRSATLRQGAVTGHPSGRGDLEWFLNEDGLSIQWGATPNLFPRARVFRLPSWGWELQNPNVVLRATVPSVAALARGLPTGDWSDMIDSIIQRKGLVVFEDGACQCRMELPRAYLQNWMEPDPDPVDGLMQNLVA